MKKILSISLLALMLCGCEPSSVKEGRELYMMYFEKISKDPSSIKIYSEKYEIDGSTVRWTLDVGGKNSYGGMARKTVKIETIGKVMLKNDDGKLINRKDLQ